MVGLICGLFIGLAIFNEVSRAGRWSRPVDGINSFAASGDSSAGAGAAKLLNIIIAVPLCSIIIFAIFNLTIMGVPGTLQEAFLGFLIGFDIIGQRGYKGS